MNPPACEIRSCAHIYSSFLQFFYISKVQPVADNSPQSVVSCTGLSYVNNSNGNDPDLSSITLTASQRRRFQQEAVAQINTRCFWYSHIHLQIWHLANTLMHLCVSAQDKKGRGGVRTCPKVLCVQCVVSWGIWMLRQGE